MCIVLTKTSAGRMQDLSLDRSRDHQSDQNKSDLIFMRLLFILQYNLSAKRENQNSVHSQFIFNKLYSHHTVQGLHILQLLVLIC